MRCYCTFRTFPYNPIRQLIVLIRTSTNSGKDNITIGPTHGNIFASNCVWHCVRHDKKDAEKDVSFHRIENLGEKTDESTHTAPSEASQTSSR